MEKCELLRKNNEGEYCVMTGKKCNGLKQKVCFIYFANIKKHSKYREYIEKGVVEVK